MDLFQRRFLKRPIKALPYNHPTESWVRQSYVGGRVEVFKAKMGPGGSWDINSSYPFAMLGDMPTDLIRCRGGGSIPDIGVVLGSFSVPRDVHIPPLHRKSGDKLFFPTGTVRGWYTSAEARYCKERFGTSSVKIERSIEYRPEPIFREYVTTLYEARLAAKAKGNLALAEACKYYMNTLYGKTGTNRIRHQIVSGAEYYHYPWNNPKALRQLRKWGGWKHLTRQSVMTQLYSEEHYIYGIPSFIEYAPYILPAIATWITAQGRLQLQGYLDEAPSDVAYCDTDSIYRETRAPSECFIGKVGPGLGKLKFEKDLAWVEFPLPKTYIGETKDGDRFGAAKGLPRKSLEAVERYVAGESVEVKRMLGAVELLARKGKISPESELQTKTRHETTQKRHPSGRAFTTEELDALEAKKI
jgi:hypothetical protein